MSKPISYDPNWQEAYQSQILSAADAVRKIRPGQRIFIGTGVGEPLQLVSALTKRAVELPDTEIVHLLTFGAAPYAHRELTQYFRVNSFFIAENVRDIIQEGLGDYTPIHLSDIPRLFDSGRQSRDFLERVEHSKGRTCRCGEPEAIHYGLSAMVARSNSNPLGIEDGSNIVWVYPIHGK